MFGIHIPNMCRTVKSKQVRELFKQINVGYVGPIIIKFSPDSNNFDNFKQSANIYFRKFHDISLICVLCFPSNFKKIMDN